MVTSPSAGSRWLAGIFPDREETAMSVLVTVRVEGDPKGVEGFDQAVIQGVADLGRAAGAIRHRFFTNGSEIMVVDEWPDRETFQAFFDSNQDIPAVMAAAGVTSMPTVEFWDRMAVDEAINWD